MEGTPERLTNEEFFRRLNDGNRTEFLAAAAKAFRQFCTKTDGSADGCAECPFRKHAGDLQSCLICWLNAEHGHERDSEKKTDETVPETTPDATPDAQSADSSGSPDTTAEVGQTSPAVSEPAPEPAPEKPRVPRRKPRPTPAAESEKAVPFSTTEAFDPRIAALSLVVSHHYRLMKAKVLRDKKAGSVTPLSPEESRLADYLADTITGLAGKRIGNYCREKFQTGYITGDLRSYKIKFVLTHLRNLLGAGRTKKLLAENLDSYVTPAEALGDCTPDDHRRNKAAREEAESRRREREAAEIEVEQLELDLDDSQENRRNVMIAMAAERMVAEGKIKIRPSKPKVDKFVKMVEDLADQEYGRNGGRDRDDLEEYARESVRNDDEYEGADYDTSFLDGGEENDGEYAPDGCAPDPTL